MRRFRGPATVLALVLLVGSVGCQTGSPGFPSTATLRLQLADPGLTFQNGDPKGFQATTWVVDSATIHIDGFGDFDFLGVKPCVFTDNVQLVDDLGRKCSGTGLVLDATRPLIGVVTVRIRSMLLRTSTQPILDPEVDTDGDGFINRNDNCPLVANPLQEDVNQDGGGDACSILDSFGAPTVLDSDQDGYPDGIDNCNLVSNADQRDVFRGADLIGDVCEQFTEVALPGGSLTLTFPVSIDDVGPTVELLLLDFNTKVAVRCDAARTTCKVVADGIQLRNAGG